MERLDLSDPELSLDERLPVEPLDKSSLLFAACQQRDPRQVFLLLTGGADPNEKQSSFYSCLHYCACVGALDVCLQLLAFGADPTAQNAKGRTALMEACEASYTHVIEPDRALTVKALADHGAPLESLDHRGMSALMIACLTGNAHSARALLIAGANPNTRSGPNLCRASALRMLVRRLAVDPQPEDAKVASLLLEFGADPAQRGSDETNSLDWLPMIRDSALRAAFEAAALRDLLPPAVSDGRSSL